MNKFLLCLLLLPIFVTAQNESGDQGRILKTKLNRLQLKMDKLLLKKSRSEDREELDETLSEIVKVHRELVTAKRNYNNFVDKLEKDNPALAKQIKEKDKAVNTLRQQAKEAEKGRATEDFQKDGDPLSDKLTSVFALVQKKYASFMETETKQLEQAKEEIQLKHFRVKERERKEYLERRSSQKLSQ